jgi:hypothetical protein
METAQTLALNEADIRRYCNLVCRFSLIRRRGVGLELRGEERGDSIVRVVDAWVGSATAAEAT